MNSYRVSLQPPTGAASIWSVTAKNKTEARRLVRAAYREETPPRKAGFYSFDQQHLTWVRITPLQS